MNALQARPGSAIAIVGVGPVGASAGLAAAFLFSFTGPLIDQFGNKTPTWDMLRNVNLQLHKLGPTYIKMGQELSTRPDLIPLEFIDELATRDESERLGAIGEDEED